MKYCRKGRLSPKQLTNQQFIYTDLEPDYSSVEVRKFIRFGLIGDRNQSLNKEGVYTKCHKCFNMDYGHHPLQMSCIPLTTLLVETFRLRKGKPCVKVKILLHVLLLLGASMVSSESAR